MNKKFHQNNTKLEKGIVNIIYEGLLKEAEMLDNNNNIEFFKEQLTEK